MTARNSPVNLLLISTLGLAGFGFVGKAPWAALAVAAAVWVAAAVLGAWLLHQFAPQERSPLRLLVFGCVLGLTLGRCLIVVAAMLAGSMAAASVLIVFAIAAAPFAALRLGRLGLRYDQEERARVVHILWLFLVLLLPMALAFSRVGALTENGQVFAAYFNNDFFQHASLVAELTRGVPPENPYFSAEPLHYYWFFHLGPAAIAKVLDVSATGVLTATAPYTALLFVAVLSVTLDTVRPGRLLAVSAALIAPSYIGLLAVASSLWPALVARISQPNTGYSLLSHSWFRDSLFEQHALTALSVLLLGIYLHRPAGGVVTRAVAGLQGLLFGTLLITDALIAVICLVFLGLDATLQWLRGKRSFGALAVSGLAAVLTAGCCVAIQAIPLQGGTLQLGLHSMAVIAPIYLVMETGPLALLGGLGIVLVFRSAPLDRRGLWLRLLVISVAVAFLVIVPTDANHVLRKGVKVLQVPLVAFAGAACAVLLSTWTRRLFVAAVVLLGSVTIATDMTHYLRPRADLATYLSVPVIHLSDWIRTCTSSTTVFQDISEVRPPNKFGDTFFSVIAALGERRTLWGDYYHPYALKVDEQALLGRRGLLERVFGATSSDDLRQTLMGLPVDVLYVDGSRPGPHDAIAGLEATGELQRWHCVSSICLWRIAGRAADSSCLPGDSGR